MNLTLKTVTTFVIKFMLTSDLNRDAFFDTFLINSKRIKGQQIYFGFRQICSLKSQLRRHHFESFLTFHNIANLTTNSDMFFSSRLTAHSRRKFLVESFFCLMVVKIFTQIQMTLKTKCN